MKNKYSCNAFKLIISDNVLNQLDEYIRMFDFKLESGGILIGQLNPVNKEYIVTDITKPYDKDKRSPCAFLRAEYGHQQRMNVLWEESSFTKTYLGEWHTHDQKTPTPSWIDVRNWRRICKRNHNASHLVFIIVGTEKLGLWTIDNEKILNLVETKVEGVEL